MRQHYIQFTHGAAALAARVYTAGQPPLIRSTTLSGADERHTSRCQKSFLRGIVYFDKRRSETACAVRNLSEDGASIVLSQTITIPDLIELEIPQREQTVIARVEWRRADEAGLSFRKLDRSTTQREDRSSSASSNWRLKSQRFSARSGVSSAAAMAGSKRLKRYPPGSPTHQLLWWRTIVPSSSSAYFSKNGSHRSEQSFSA